MRKRGIARFFVHSISVQTWLGTGSNGNVYAAAVTLSPAAGNGVLVDDAIHLVRNKDGDEVTSQGHIAAPLSTVSLFTPDSLVTILGDSDGDEIAAKPRRVIVVNTADAAGLNLPEHVVISLT